MEKIRIKNSAGAGAKNEVPPAVEVDLPGLKGTLPFMPGRAIGASGNVPYFVREEEQYIKEAPIVTPEKELRKAIKPQVVNIEELTEDKQAEVLTSVADSLSKKTSQSAQPFIPRGPGISEAKRLADRVAAQAEARIAQAKTPTPAVAPKPVVTPPEPTPEPEPEKANAGSDIQAGETCVHCGWPAGSKDGCNPTPMDKQLFVAAVLGQRRFIKEYDLLGGQMHVQFRSLTVEENDLVIKQLMEDWNLGKISGPAHSVTEATKYQLAMSLASIETNIGPIKLPELDGYEFETPTTATVLPELVAYITKTAVPNEHTRRIISKAYGHFIDTQSKLEAMAENSDFWNATAD